MSPTPTGSRRALPVAVVLVAIALALLWPGLRPSAPGPAASTSPSREATDPASGLPWLDVADLPVQVAQTLDVIADGPPFPYRQDGMVFRNAEGLLPERASGYYHEFTVPTPGEDDRGARRIVTGGSQHGRAEGEYYYTDDHYESFGRIRP